MRRRSRDGDADMGFEQKAVRVARARRAWWRLDSAASNMVISERIFGHTQCHGGSTAVSVLSSRPAVVSQFIPRLCTRNKVAGWVSHSAPPSTLH